MCCYSPYVLSESEKRLCSIADTEAISFHDLVGRLPYSTFLELKTQADAPDDAWEEEITGWDPRSTRDLSSGSSFWPQQPDATSRLGPDLVPPSRPVRADDEMSVQKQETTHVPVAHPLASESFHLTFLLVRLNRKIQHRQCPRVTSRSKRPPNPVDRAEPPKTYQK